MNEDVRKLVDDFFSSYQEIKYPKGQLLLFPGELSDRVFYLASGRVSVYDVSYRGDEIILFTFVPLSYFPMATVINNAPNRFFYKTETDAVLRAAKSEDFNKFIRRTSAVSYHLLSRSYERFEFILERTLHLITGSARNRLAFELMVEYTTYGIGNKNSGYIEASESSIASRAGLSRETVSREMKRLKEAGIIKLKNRKIYIADIPQLRTILESYS